MIYCQRIFSAVFPEQEILPSLIRAQGFPAEVGKPEVDGAMCGQPSWGQGPAPMSYDVILLEVTLLGNWEMQSTFTSGWWFGTFWIFPYIGNVIIPIDVHIFQRGLVNHQPDVFFGALCENSVPLSGVGDHWTNLIGTILTETWVTGGALNLDHNERSTTNPATRLFGRCRMMMNDLYIHILNDVTIK